MRIAFEPWVISAVYNQLDEVVGKGPNVEPGFLTVKLTVAADGDGCRRRVGIYRPVLKIRARRSLNRSAVAFEAKPEQWRLPDHVFGPTAELSWLHSSFISAIELVPASS